MVKCTKREVRALRTALRWKLPALQRQRIQMVLLRESGMTQPAIAVGVSLSTVNRVHMAYDQGGLEAALAKRASNAFSCAIVMFSRLRPPHGFGLSCCHPVSFMMAAIVAPWGRPNIAITLACLEPARMMGWPDA